ncbi:protein Wnt-2 isoform X1 [Daktulosphaira vitifoliae]|uniref:protein Wnt-2 isoform X1 n=2 Tax=Daktulosphaira vitifoliae TaxID=58002 RepID=UPI0021A9E169|nr:protein Wnt-2 isoform X1 [Daktulosphaira vitifoliae]
MRKVRKEFTIKALFWIILLIANLRTSVSAFGAQVICNRITGLTAGQRRICAAAPDAMAAVGHGIRMAKQECQIQFNSHRWNCTGPTKGNPFGHLQITASREAAYMYAVISAGVTYSLMDACSRGNISICGCDTHYSGVLDVGPTASSWKWGGCSVDLNFGMGFARKFLDAQESDASDPRSLMNLHNNKAGRKIVKQLLNTDCKCHGVSGSCTMKTCWHSLPHFRHVGKALMKKYWKARGVSATPTMPRPQSFTTNGRSKRPHGKRSSRRLKLKLRLARSTSINQEEPRITELVYLEQSPNYCDRDYGTGSLGTHGRLCNRTSEGTDGCDLLCCGRGYNTHQFVRSKQCRCTFYWCCYVKCDTCVERIEEYTCK